MKLLKFSKEKFSSNPYSQHRSIYFQQLGDKKLSTISVLFKEPKLWPFHFFFPIVPNEMKSILKSRMPKRLMGLKVHHDGFNLANSLEW